MESRENEESIIQNLKDAGCNAETIEKFMAALREGNQAHGLKQLAAYRRTLLDVIHQEQPCLSDAKIRKTIRLTGI